MIVVDTNIISELMRPEPAESVIHWINNQQSSELYVTAVTVAEIRYGLLVLPHGGRRSRLTRSFDNALKAAFHGRILSFDEHAAIVYAELMASRQAAGQPMALPDGQIAAIARVHESVLATRNTRDFVNCGIELANPFHQ